ncbi:hypothetical protein B484DRAFT_441808 [Ochromonadaceae sp. CCMP2298]|nr:hypothetical protein B484DRAFT_441808 [Ochromonadaceae sp. CCMP2298]
MSSLHFNNCYFSNKPRSPVNPSLHTPSLHSPDGNDEVQQTSAEYMDACNTQFMAAGGTNRILYNRKLCNRKLYYRIPPLLQHYIPTTTLTLTLTLLFIITL